MASAVKTASSEHLDPSFTLRRRNASTRCGWMTHIPKKTTLANGCPRNWRVSVGLPSRKILDGWGLEGRRSDNYSKPMVQYPQSALSTTPDLGGPCCSPLPSMQIPVPVVAQALYVLPLQLQDMEKMVLSRTNDLEANSKVQFYRPIKGSTCALFPCLSIIVVLPSSRCNRNQTSCGTRPGQQGLDRTLQPRGLQILRRP